MHEILGYECLKAVSRDGKKTAWFTRHIPVPNEPFVCGLTGLLLEYDDGNQLFTATDVRDAIAGDIHRPDEGEAVQADTFKEMVRKQMARMNR